MYQLRNRLENSLYPLYFVQRATVNAIIGIKSRFSLAYLSVYFSVNQIYL